MGSSSTSGTAPGPLFALVLLNASIIGAAAVTLSTSYAVGDMFGIRHSLHRSVRGREAVLRHLHAGWWSSRPRSCSSQEPHWGSSRPRCRRSPECLLPSATVFLLLLCNDQEVLGPWVNRPWLNVLAGFIVAVLLALSLILMATTVFPNLNVDTLALVLGAIIAVGFLGMGVWAAPSRPAREAACRSGRPARGREPGARGPA